jgi:hypothetical protein
LAVYLLAKQRLHSQMVLLVLPLIAVVFSSLLVVDVSRGAMFAFPAILTALLVLQNLSVDVNRMRIVMGLSAVVSLLVPNFEINKSYPVLGRLPSYLGMLFS